jgi:hypothetical protein
MRFKLQSNPKFKLATDPKTPPETLTLLAQDTIDDIRLEVTGHPNMLPETLAFLARDNYCSVRWNVARDSRFQNSSRIFISSCSR